MTDTNPDSIVGFWTNTGLVHVHVSWGQITWDGCSMRDSSIGWVDVSV